MGLFKKRGSDTWRELSLVKALAIPPQVVFDQSVSKLIFHLRHITSYTIALQSSLKRMLQKGEERHQKFIE